MLVLKIPHGQKVIVTCANCQTRLNMFVKKERENCHEIHFEGHPMLRVFREKTFERILVSEQGATK